MNYILQSAATGAYFKSAPLDRDGVEVTYNESEAVVFHTVEGATEAAQKIATSGMTFKVVEYDVYVENEAFEALQAEIKRPTEYYVLVRTGRGIIWLQGHEKKNGKTSLVFTYNKGQAYKFNIDAAQKLYDVARSMGYRAERQAV